MPASKAPLQELRRGGGVPKSPFLSSSGFSGQLAQDDTGRLTCAVAEVGGPGSCCSSVWPASLGIFRAHVGAAGHRECTRGSGPPCIKQRIHVDRGHGLCRDNRFSWDSRKERNVVCRPASKEGLEPTASPCLSEHVSRAAASRPFRL